jgi:RNA polymerase sigma-70 factor, ECF subfamily
MEETNSNAQLYPVEVVEQVHVEPERPATGNASANEASAAGAAATAALATAASLNAAEDLKLLRRAGAGDGKAFHQLVDRHAGRLFGLAYSLLGNSADAEDVVQETMVGAFRGLNGFEGRSSVATWLTRILVLQAAKWRRDHRRPAEQTVPLGEQMVGERLGSESGAAAVERRLDLQAALNQLSPEHRQVLVLREFEGHSYEEIAQLLGVPRGTVESRLHRARGELKLKLREYI